MGNQGSKSQTEAGTSNVSKALAGQQNSQQTDPEKIKGILAQKLKALSQPKAKEKTDSEAPNTISKNVGTAARGTTQLAMNKDKPAPPPKSRVVNVNRSAGAVKNPLTSATEQKPIGITFPSRAKETD